MSFLHMDACREAVEASLIPGFRHPFTKTVIVNVKPGSSQDKASAASRSFHRGDVRRLHTKILKWLCSAAVNDYD